MTIVSKTKVRTKKVSNKTDNLPLSIYADDPLFQKKLPIGFKRLSDTAESHINDMTAKEWLKCQLGVWEFYYERRDIRDKNLHPATFPISLANRVLELFSCAGELVLDPFVGSGTTLISAQELNRNAVGFDLQKKYIELCQNRLGNNTSLFSKTWQVAINDDARKIEKYLKPESVKLIWTSPPYANLLNRKRKNKSKKSVRQT